MDELKEAWGSIKSKSEGFMNLTEEEIRSTVNYARPSGIIEKLRKKVKAKLIYAITFTLLFAIIIPFAMPLASQILLTILVVAYLVGSTLLYQELQVLNKGVDMSQNLLKGLESYRDRIKRVIRYEEAIGLTLYPVSASGGFFLGMQIVDREAEIMTRSFQWVVLILTIILFTILGHWTAKWLNKKAFGKYLEKLEDNIRELGD